MVELNYEGRKVRAPVWVQPGHVNGAVTVHLGYGRTRAGRVGTGWDSIPTGCARRKALWHDSVSKRRRPRRYVLFANTQNQHVLDTRRHVIHEANIEEYRKNPDSVHEGAEVPPRTLTMYPGVDVRRLRLGHGNRPQRRARDVAPAWSACQAENNIPVVGKDQVRRSRDDALDARGHLLSTAT